MKYNFSKIKYKFTRFLLISAVLSAAFTSCDLFNPQPLSDFLEEHATKIKIISAEFPEDYETDKENVLSISSQADYSIKYYVQNPQCLTIYPVITNEADDILSSLTGSDQILQPYTYEVSPDNDCITVTLSRDAIEAIDKRWGTKEKLKDRFISPVINLTAKDYTDPIPEFSETVRANTVPPLIQGACLMIDTSTKNNASQINGEYVLCFNLPDSLFIHDGIHTDVQKIYIDGLSSSNSNASKFSQGIPLSIDFETMLYNSDLPVAPSTGLLTVIASTLKDNDNGLPVTTFTAGQHPVYINTKQISRYNDSTVYNYSLTLEDSFGLKSTVHISNNDKQLKPVTATSSSEQLIPLKLNATDSEKEEEKRKNTKRLQQGAATYKLSLNSPSAAQGLPNVSIENVEIYYEVEWLDLVYGRHSNIWGNKIGQVDLEFKDDSLYQITAYAKKEGYLDSIINKWELTIGEWTIEPVRIDMNTLYDVYIYIKPNVIYRDQLQELGDAQQPIKLNVSIYDKTRNEWIENPEYDKEPQMQLKDIHGNIASGRINPAQIVNKDSFIYYLPKSVTGAFGNDSKFFMCVEVYFKDVTYSTELPLKLEETAPLEEPSQD